VAAAVDGQDSLIGYFIYRVANIRAVLVHLCVSPAYRRIGVAKLLVDDLVERTRDLRGISISTRRDFIANQVWPRLGFAPIGERPGRGQRRTVLTNWWLEHPHETLFSIASLSRTERPPTDVVIDLNVFYDLHIDRENSEESRALLADWLLEEIRLCASSELLIEIDRLPDADDRTCQKLWAGEYERVSGPEEEFRRAYTDLVTIFGQPTSRRKDSDLRHIARTAASGRHFFLTRDEELLRQAVAIETQLGVKVMRPASLIVDLDEIRNESSYRPARLGGSQIHHQRVSSDSIGQILDAFTEEHQGESKSSFRTYINRLLASPTQVYGWSFQHHGKPVGLVFLDERTPLLLAVPLLRVAAGPLAPTIARFALKFATEQAIKFRCPLVRVTDPHVNTVVSDALAESSYFLDKGQWSKFNILAIGDPKQICANLDDMLFRLVVQNLGISTGETFSDAARSLDSCIAVADLERTLFPAKIIKAGLPTYLIPIRPIWAQNLFDEGLARQSLLETQARLILNWENVYYRSPKASSGLQAPARILWYVSKDWRYSQTGCIRACSQALEVVFTSAKEAFSKFGRLGVYEWRDLLRITNNQPDGSVMAIRFADTELLADPISFAEAQDIIHTCDGIRPPFQGPQRISDDAFTRLYVQGTGRAAL